jgi:hypothetical protein
MFSRISLFVAFLTLLSFEAYSATRTSTGNNWSTAGHWTSSGGPGVPQTGDIVIINTNMTISTLTNTPVLSSITVNALRTLIVNGVLHAATITINGNLNLNGDGVSTGILDGGNNFAGVVTVNGGLNTSGNGKVTVASLTNNSSVFLGDGLLELYYDLTNSSGSFSSSGTVSFIGNVPQTIFGVDLSFTNVLVTTGRSVKLDDAAVVNLAGTMTLESSASFDADGTGNAGLFTVLSQSDTPTIDGSIATLPAGASFTGNVTVQRYMSLVGLNSARIYRYISSPVQNAPASHIQATIPITGSFTGSDNGTCVGCLSNQSMFSYDESATGTLNAGFVDFPSNDNSETLQKGKGYALYVRGNILGDGTWSVRGPINSGTVNYNISFTNNNGAGDDGWNLIGNPYPSTIDWESAGWTSTNVGNTISYIDNVSGFVSTYTRGGATTNGGVQNIAMGQAFYVKASALGSSLTSDETVKVGGTQTTFFRKATATPDNMLRIALSKGNLRDESILIFKDGATDNFDPAIDALKIKNKDFANVPFLNLSTLTLDKYKLVVNSLPFPTTAKSIALDISDVSQGSHQLNFSNFESFAPTVTINLLDKFTNTTQDVRVKPSYDFSVDVADAKTFGSDRFVLTFDGPFVVTGLENNGFEGEVSIFPNPTSGSIGVEVTSSVVPTVQFLNSFGQMMDAIDLVSSGAQYKGNYNLSAHASGIYFVRIIDGKTGIQIVRKIIKN